MITANWKTMAATAVILGLLAVGCTSQNDNSPTELLEFLVWHTESDKSAQQILKEAAASAEERFQAENPNILVDFKISYQAWGDLAQRLLQQTEQPPDVTHLQPFMVYQILRQYEQSAEFELHPLTSLVGRLEEQNGPVVPALRSLQQYRKGGSTDIYGLAYAVGTTFIAYRADFANGDLEQPTSWRDLLDVADRLAQAGSESLDRPVAPFILPGNSKFFMDQLFNEIVVSLGGSLFEEDGSPNFDSEEVYEALDITLEMIKRTDGKYYSTSYLDQFEGFARGDGAMVPVTYGRASATIERVIAEGDRGAGALEDYRVMHQPGGAERLGTATVDAEPWVIIARSSRNESLRVKRIRLAELFLEEFYAKERYLAFCGAVPVHLRPIFPRFWEEYDTLAPQRRWAQWTTTARETLLRDGGTAPILMSPGGGSARYADYLLDLSRQNVISDMINDAWENRAEGSAAKARAISRAAVRVRALDEQSDDSF